MSEEPQRHKALADPDFVAQIRRFEEQAGFPPADLDNNPSLIELICAADRHVRALQERMDENARHAQALMDELLRLKEEVDRLQGEVERLRSPFDA